ncbi:MAG: pyridoxal phosphate-dependent aminotransferase [Calditrichia bacterium]
MPMPKFPGFSDRVKQIPPSVFEKFRKTIKSKGENLIRLHIGDTYLPPPYALPIESEFLSAHPGFSRYCDTFGIESLRREIVKKLREDNHLTVEIENILITSGATNALSASVLALLNPEEEILVLTPCWPFFPGMVRLAGARVVEVPFYVQLFEQPDLNIFRYLEQYVTERTVALYLNTPNNPSGKVLTEAQLREIAELAQTHRLWIISDEAYDGLVFDDYRHISIATLPDMFAQTLSIFTFSKSLMFAGIRLGYLATEADTIQHVNKCMVHQLYSPPTITQQMMIEPLKQRHQFIPQIRKHYQSLRDLFLAHLAAQVNVPEGTYFLFFPVDQFLNGRHYWDLINDFLNAGVTVAPGEDFGKDFSHYVRLCFTGEPPQRLKTSIERINKVLEGSE